MDELGEEGTVRDRIADALCDYHMAHIGGPSPQSAALYLPQADAVLAVLVPKRLGYCLCDPNDYEPTQWLHDPSECQDPVECVLVYEARQSASTTPEEG